MKQGQTIQQLAAEVASAAVQRGDYIASTSQMAYSYNDDGLRVSFPSFGEQQYGVSKIAHEQLASTLGIPKAYYDRMHDEWPEGLVETLRHWSDASPSRRLVRTYIEGGPKPQEVRAVLSASYRRLDNNDLLEAAIPVLASSGQPWEVASANVSDANLYLKVLLPKIQNEVRKVGDVVQLGLMIRNSEVGKGALSVYPFLHELSCLNGTVFQRMGSRRAHIGSRIEDDVEGWLTSEAIMASDQAFWLRLRDSIKHLSSQAMLDQLVEECRAAQAKQIVGSPVEAVKVLAKQENLLVSEQESVLEQLIRGGNYTQWGMSQAVTAASQLLDDYDRATDLEILGGSIVRMPRPTWLEVK